jgi:tetratricopeptide (TPR) repeat protein
MDVGDHTKSAEQHFERYREAHTLYRAGEQEAARTALESILEDEEGAASAKARMLLADIHLKAKDFSRAEALLSSETARLLSPKRRREVAEIYLELADTALQAETLGLGQTADYPKALRLLEFLIEMDLPTDLEEAVYFRRAQTALKGEEYYQARDFFQQYLERFDPLYAREILGRLPGQTHPQESGERLIAARLGLLEAELRVVEAMPDPDNEEDQEDFGEGVADWALTLVESTLRHLENDDLPKGCSFTPAQLRRIRYLRPLVAGLSRRFDPYSPAATGPASCRCAVRYAEEFLEHHRDSPEGLEILRLLPRALFLAGFRKQAMESLRTFLERPPLLPEGAPQDRLSRSMDLASFALGAMQLASGHWQEATEAFQEYLSRHPDGARWQEAQEASFAAAAAQGYQALGEDEFSRAREIWSQVAARRGLHDTAGWLTLASAYCTVLEARKAKQEEKPRKARSIFQQAIEELSAVARRYPDEIADLAHFYRGKILEKEINDLEAAVKAYRKAEIAPASEALAKLEAVEIGLVAPRVFRTCEVPEVLLQIRNIEKVTLRRYPINLGDFFRKYHTTERVDRLDLDLVHPAQTWIFEVPKYCRFQNFEAPIPLEIDGPGAHAITVEGGNHEVTVLAVVSDLEVVLASTHKEALILVQDLEQNAPIEGAQVQFWGGPHPSQNLDLTTGKDGVARGSFAEGPSESPYVFASWKGHVAVSGLDLPTRSQVSLQSRGLLQTSRPVYLPGDLVEVRGVIRTVFDGCYQIEKGASYQLELVSPQGIVLGERRVRLSHLGTFLTRFRLPQGNHLGEHQLRARRQAHEGESLQASEPTYFVSFQVQHVLPSKLFLKLTPSAPAVLAGDLLTLTLEAGFYTGAPLVGRAVVVSLPDGRRVQVVTDEAGKATLELDTTPFFRHQELPLRAHIQGEDVSGKLTIPLLPAAVVLKTRTSLPDRLAGEHMSLPVTLETPGGDPLPASEVELRLFRVGSRKDPLLPEDIQQGMGLERNQRHREEELFHQEILTTDPEGQVRFSFKLVQTGKVRAVLLARDAAGREASLTRTFQVRVAPSPALNIEADAAELLVGQECSLRLRYRDRPGLGLLLVTGDQILSYQVHGFERGVRSHRFSVNPSHLPNMTLIALAPGERRLHRAEQEFEVRRHLLVSYQLPEEPLQPGQEAKVELLARDERGKPVEADLCFRLLDQGLLEKYPDRTPHLVRYFETEARRSVNLQAASSVSYKRIGEKREISQEVLEEEHRLELEQECEKDLPEMLGDMDCMMDDFEGALPCANVAFGMEAMPMAPPPPCPAPRAGGAPPMPRRMKRKSRHERTRGDLPEEPNPAAGQREELPVGAVWLGRVLTNAEGRATVSFRVPERCSKYATRVQGVGAGNLFGQSEGEVVVRRDLLVSVRLPGHAFEGDEVRPLVRVENSGEFTGDLDLELELRAGGTRRTFSHSLTISGKGLFELTSGPMILPVATRLEARLAATHQGTQLDAVSLFAPVRPWGNEVRAGESGVLTDTRRIRLTLPEGTRDDSQTLTLTFHSPETDALLQEPLDTPLLPDFRDGFGVDVTAARFLAQTQCLRVLSGRSDLSGPLEKLRHRCQNALTGLIAQQGSNGGWDWIASTRDSQDPDLGSTAWCLLALCEAHELGLVDDNQARTRALDHLSRRGIDFASGQEDSLLALLAMAHAGAGDFSIANRLFRKRQDLSLRAQARLAQVFLVLDKTDYAEQILEGIPGLPPHASLEEIGLLVQARNQAGLRDSATRAMETRLREENLTSWWRGTPYWIAQAALAHAAPQGKEVNPDVTIQILVSGQEIGNYLGKGVLQAQSFRVPAQQLGSAPVEVELRYLGCGPVAFQALLTGFHPRHDGCEALRGVGLQRERFFHSPRLYKGRLLRNSTMQVEQVAFEDHIQSSLKVSPSRTKGVDPGPYTVLEIWIPGGLRVDKTSLPTDVLSIQEDRGKLTMIYRGRPGRFRIDLLPLCPGSYRIPGATLSSARFPERLDRLEHSRRITVLCPGEKDETPYSWNPKEHIAFGLAHFEDGDEAAALDHLKQVPPQKVRQEQEVARALLWIRCKPEFYLPDRVIDLFEILEQRFPDVTIPYEKLLAVGHAYHDAGEDEAACLLWRSTIQACFRDDIPVAADLEEAQEYLRGVEYVERLFWSYPDLPTVIHGLYNLSQDVYAHKNDLSSQGLPPHKVVKRAIDILVEFLGFFSHLPYADEATFSLLSALRELGAHEACVRQASQAASRYPESQYLDRFHYLRALGAFFLEDFEDAILAAQDVAQRAGPDARTALFLLGQMYQALGRTDEALTTYRQVEFDFPDAARSIRYLERRSLSMPEVVQTIAGAPVRVSLRYVGIQKVEILAYKVDLMRLFLKERNLDRIAGVGLAGINPTCTFERELPKVPDGTTGVSQIELPFEEVGAYLVLARSQEAFASGLALVTPLTMETMVYPDGIRVMVLDGNERSPAREVYVKVSDGTHFHSGKTDLRGALTLNTRGSELTVVARRNDNEYAFHRAQRTDNPDIQGFSNSLGNLDQVAYDEGIQATNILVQQQASQQLRNFYQRRSKSEKGVSASRVRKSTS